MFLPKWAKEQVRSYAYSPSLPNKKNFYDFVKDLKESDERDIKYLGYMVYRGRYRGSRGNSQQDIFPPIDGVNMLFNIKGTDYLVCSTLLKYLVDYNILPEEGRAEYSIGTGGRLDHVERVYHFADGRIFYTKDPHIVRDVADKKTHSTSPDINEAAHYINTKMPIAMEDRDGDTMRQGYRPEPIGFFDMRGKAGITNLIGDRLLQSQDNFVTIDGEDMDIKDLFLLITEKCPALFYGVMQGRKGEYLQMLNDKIETNRQIPKANEHPSYQKILDKISNKIDREESIVDKNTSWSGAFSCSTSHATSDWLEI